MSNYNEVSKDEVIRLLTSLEETYNSKCAEYNDLKCAVDERTKLYSEQTNTINKLCARIHKLEKIIISKELEKLENE